MKRYNVKEQRDHAVIEDCKGYMDCKDCKGCKELKDPKEYRDYLDPEGLKEEMGYLAHLDKI